MAGLRGRSGAETIGANGSSPSLFWRQWGWPLGLALLILFGLLSALLGQHGVWWALSWAALAIPLLVILRYWPLRRLFLRKARP